MVEKEKVSQDMKILDALITVTENWKLLVLGPLAAALLIIPISLLWPKTYESVGIVRLNEAEQALITTNTFLNPLIDKMGLLAEFDSSREEAREYLIKK